MTWDELREKLVVILRDKAIQTSLMEEAVKSSFVAELKKQKPLTKAQRALMYKGVRYEKENPPN